MYFTQFIVGDPFVNLFAQPKVARAHFGAVEAKPLPVAVHLTVGHFAFGPNTSVTMMLVYCSVISLILPLSL